MKSEDIVKEQAPPIPNSSRAIWDIVIEEFEHDSMEYYVGAFDAEMLSSVLDDMKARHEEGIRKYGTALQVGNGRDPAVDAFQEILDAVVYTRQAVEDRIASGAGDDIADMWMEMHSQAIFLLIDMKYLMRAEELKGVNQ